MKKLKILLPILLILIIIISVLVVYTKSKSREKFISFMTENREIPDNVYIKSELSNTNPKWDKSIDETYKKGNKIYTKESSSSNPNIEETFWDLDNKTEIIVNNQFNEIHINSIKRKELYNPVTLTYFETIVSLNNSNVKYKYCGIENNILKISLRDDYTNTLDYHYINTQNKEVIKVEYGSNFDNKFDLQSTKTYTYSYNTVTDEDITFDINKYPNYTVKDETK